MAFVSAAANTSFVGARRLVRACSTRPRRFVVRAETESPAAPVPAVEDEPEVAQGPVVPKNFKVPEPRRFYVRPDRIADIATGSLSSLVRLSSGGLIEGYRLTNENGSVVERSTTLPETRPRLLLRVFEFEACPFCRKVREAISTLDLDAIFFPCPKNGTSYRPYVVDTGGKAQFPYLQDPNTGVEMYESADIIDYLYKTYGPQSSRPPALLGNFGTLTAGVASLLRAGKGSRRQEKVVPAPKPLELYGYEPSPFSKVVRERLVELELPYILRTTPRGSPTREKLRELTGVVQMPYLIDHNTGIKLFESASIVEYLTATYGTEAPGAVEKPASGMVFLPAFTEGSDGTEVLAGPPASGASLDPQQKKDEALEEYCKENPDADECRVYED